MIDASNDEEFVVRYNFEWTKVFLTCECVSEGKIRLIIWSLQVPAVPARTPFLFAVTNDRRQTSGNNWEAASAFIMKIEAYVSRWKSDSDAAICLLENNEQIASDGVLDNSCRCAQVSRRRISDRISLKPASEGN